MSGRATTAGRSGPTASPANHALIEHWNGTSWRIVADPVRPRGQEQLATITALSARSAWASASSSPGAASVLTGLAGSSATNAWAVGEYRTKACPSPQAANRGRILILRWDGAPVTQPLTLHWNGQRWRAG